MSYFVFKEGSRTRKASPAILEAYFYAKGGEEEDIYTSCSFYMNYSVFPCKGKIYAVTRISHFNGHFSGYTDPAAVDGISVREVEVLPKVADLIDRFKCY